MKTFPMFLKMEDRSVVIVGGGEQAAQKCRLMLKTAAKIQLVAQTPDPELEGYVDTGRITRVSDPTELFGQAALVFIATGCKGADAGWAHIAKDRGALVNVVDYPDLCDAYTPSIVDRAPVVVAIGTEGTAPVLGRQIKSKIEQILEPNLGRFAQFCGDLRGRVAMHIAQSDRRLFWRWVFGGPPRWIFASGSERESVSLLKDAIEGDSWRALDINSPIHEMEVDWRQPDLISMRDARRLQEADIIAFDDQNLSSVLEYARRDATRRLIDPANGHDLDQLIKEATDQRQSLVIVKQRTRTGDVIDISRHLVGSF